MRLALRDGHIPLQGLAEAAALPPAPRTQASVRATPPAPGQTPPAARAVGAPQTRARSALSSAPRCLPRRARVRMGYGQSHRVRRWAALWAPSSPRKPDRPRGPVEEPRLDVKRMPQCPASGLGGDMASLLPLSPYLSPTVLLLVSCDLGSCQ
ncbi:uncharacterized protein LOC118147375 [Callithrix jacchus]